jgi:HAD superfamily phosphatase (TIGR01681 family)
MPDKSYKGLLVSDFTLDNFAQQLIHDSDPPLIEAVPAPFGQIQAVLVDPGHPIWNESPFDFAVVWTQPQAVIEYFGNLLQYQPVDLDKLLAQVDDYCMMLNNLPEQVRFIFVPTWLRLPPALGFGLLEMTPNVGINHALSEMNLRLSKNLSGESNIFVLDATRWLSATGSKAFNPKLWYMAKIPFANEVFAEAVKDVKAALNALTGNARKLIVVDLDETLWGGIVGDDGWENLRLGGHDHIGESYVDFQRTLKALTNRGILLGVVSKNEENIALEAIDKHPEMVLKRDDFAGWRINWNDKVQNIVELVDELNLGLQSVVFLDDNPMERAWVRESLPEVFVPEMPEDKMLYPNTVLELRCFDNPSVSSEENGRSSVRPQDRLLTGC